MLPKKPLSTAANDLPEPDEAARERSQRLCLQIGEQLKSKAGSMAFSAYMHEALYAPGLGYYSGGLQKFGAGGDFITAPEVSPLFSQCLARQVVEIMTGLQQSGSGTTGILEFGAGSGVMAAELLLELERLEQLPSQYYILEVSTELRQRQRETLQQKTPHLVGRVEWLEALPETAFSGVILANEVLDAMPVECFRRYQGKIEALRISSGEQPSELITSYAEADAAMQLAVSVIEERLEAAIPDDYCSEYNPAIAGWLQSLADVLQQGAVLLIDYGYNVHEYYHEERSRGSLMCHYQHRAHTDPLWYPGLQDITAFVDFSDVAYSALSAGFDVSGYTTQAMFLMASGLADLHQAQVTDDPKQQILLAQQIKTLTLPSEMGERFKVMALTKKFDEPLIGFSMQDLRNRL